MKTVIITGDPWITDADMLMKNLEYLFGNGSLPPEFEVITQNAPGVEATINPMLEEAGLKVTVVDELPEVDIVVVFLDNSDERAHAIMMAQWGSRKPVFPFHVSKKGAQ